MKRTIRLTESDLTRIVRRVINEQKSYYKIESLIKGAGITNWWNKQPIMNVIQNLGTCEEFKELYSKAKSMGYNSIHSWIYDKLKLTPDYDRDQAAFITNPLRHLGTGLTDEEYSINLKRKLDSWGAKCFPKK